MNVRMLMRHILAVTVVLLGSTAFGQTQPAAVEIEVLKSRLASIQNLAVEYSLSERFPASEQSPNAASIDLGGGMQVIRNVKPKQYRKVFQFLAGKARYEAELAAELLASAAPHEWRTKVETYTQSRTEVLEQNAKDEGYNGNISDPASLPILSVVDVALGLRGQDEDEWLEPDSLGEFKMEFPDENLVTLEKPDGKIESRRHVWTYDRNLGFALVRYQVFAGDRLYIEAVNSDFETVDNVPLPRRIAWRQHRFDKDGTPSENMAKDVTVQRYTLNDPENTDERYMIVYPVGSSVFDARTETPVVVRSGDRTIDDETLKQVAARTTQGVIVPDVDEAGDDRPAWPRRWLLIANLMIVVGIVLFVCYRRVRYRRQN